MMRRIKPVRIAVEESPCFVNGIPLRRSLRRASRPPRGAFIQQGLLVGDPACGLDSAFPQVCLVLPSERRWTMLWAWTAAY